MTGDDRARHCAECDLMVYDLSRMTTDEAAALFQQSTGRVCARFFRRADGTVVTRDCSTGVVRLGGRELDHAVVNMIPRDWAERICAIVVGRKTKSEIVVAMRDPADVLALDEVKFLTGMDVEAVYAPEADIREAIERGYAGDDGFELMGAIMEDPIVDPDPVPLVPETAKMSREFILAEVARSLRATHPDRADAMIRELERETLLMDHSGAAACPHCSGPVVAPDKRK